MFTNRISNNLDQLQFFVEFLNENYETQKHLSLTPLNLAAGNGQLDLVNTLLGEGLDINSEIKYDGFTPLYFAIAKNRLEMVNFLVAHGADVNHKAILGFTPLSFASQQGYLLRGTNW
ncbi:ankyrin repeat domain-containing protein [Wolbachia pipientis]|uniref:ankyrin repeat domain-containing protein n=1 Tax=Wolbachia pipientis TaxID=955 RepID=UPI0021750325|nr:ankyrin repeat domain-containing protein [Wolbachia pipientis]